MSAEADDDEATEGRALPLDGVLDLHAFQPREIADLVPTWLDACAAAGLTELRIVHGKGRGVQRRTVHAILARRSDVLDYRLAGPGRGSWGATLVTLSHAAHAQAGMAPLANALVLAFEQAHGVCRLHAAQLLAVPPEPLFTFCADPHHGAALAPPFLRFRSAKPAPLPLAEGTRLEYEVSMYGLPFAWVGVISVWQPPTRFVIEQLRGPFARFRHEHSFAPRGADSLRREQLTYALPWGRLLEARLVRPKLQKLMAARRAHLAARFGEPPAA